jgi:hypothetical protein
MNAHYKPKIHQETGMVLLPWSAEPVSYSKQVIYES